MKKNCLNKCYCTKVVIKENVAIKEKVAMKNVIIQEKVDCCY